MSFNIGLSGIQAASSGLNVTGNNIANAGTVGFKQSRAEFADVYAASVLGSGSNPQGSGVLLSDISQMFKQGNFETTNSVLDLAINGNGFFVTSNNGAISYTRAGYFNTDKQDFIVDNNGYRLQGYAVGPNGQLQNGVVTDLKVERANQAPKATSSIQQSYNLDSTKKPPTVTPFDPSDASTYTSSSSLGIYDSQGNAHTMSQFFIKNEPNPNATPPIPENSWTMKVLIDGVNPLDPSNKTPMSFNVSFDASGQMTSVRAPDGSEAYVRTAGMHIDAVGMLRTGDGLPVLGNGGPIAVPPEEKVEIGQDGTISIRALGENPNVVAVVDRIKLVNPNLKQMEKGTDGLLHYKPQPGEQVPLADANVKVVSGFLESSNVNAVEEMTAILSLSRQFELHVKMMRTAEDDSAAMARVLQIS